MKLALNGATTMRASLETDFAAAKAAGFDYVEIWAAKLRKFLEQQTTDALRNLIAESGVLPLSINSIEHVTFRDAHAYESIKAECEERAFIDAGVNQTPPLVTASDGLMSVALVRVGRVG